MNKSQVEFFAHFREALTYGDVRLETDYSDIMPSETLLDTSFSRNIKLRMPIVSAAMDRVTEFEMAIAMAEYGGIGIIHKNMPPEEQAKQVSRVKHYLNGLINHPICVKADDTIEMVLNMRDQHGFTFHSFPVIKDGKLVGILTRNDFDFAPSTSARIDSVMTPSHELTTAPNGTSITTAYELMRKSKKKLLPLIDNDGSVTGLYVFSDLRRIHSNQSAHNVDKGGHLRVAAAVGVGEKALERAELLAEKKCDAFVIDSAHADSANVHATVKDLKQMYPDIDIVAGNISRGEAARRLADIGVDGIIVGQGPGSICTTRIVAGVGCPQVTAVHKCIAAIEGSGIPVCADGGIENSGDMVVALGLDAQSVIIGRMLAGTDEAPGETRIIEGISTKEYRGMGSLGAMQDSAGSRERYRQGNIAANKLVPEGVEVAIPAIGPVRKSLDQYLGGIRAGMAYIGARTISALAEKAELIRITNAGLKESHPHDVLIIKDAPNYRRL